MILAIAGKAPVDLKAGRYVYAGSANGPGGIRARVGRHLKVAKKVRWHVDRLTTTAGVAAVVALPEARECRIVAFLREKHAAGVPIPGFGSSDCRVCESHLVKVADALELEEAKEALALAAAVGCDEEVVTWHRPPAAGFGKPPPASDGAG